MIPELPKRPFCCHFGGHGERHPRARVLYDFLIFGRIGVGGCLIDSPLVFSAGGMFCEFESSSREYECFFEANGPYYPVL